jgi:hypothetical protein
MGRDELDLTAAEPLEGDACQRDQLKHTFHPLADCSAHVCTLCHHTRLDRIAVAQAKRDLKGQAAKPTLAVKQALENT